MNFKEQMLADLDIFFNPDEFAEAIQYNGQEILAIPEIGEDNQKGNTFTSSQGSAGIAYFSIKEADVAWPESPDVIVYKGITWYVARVIESSGGTHRVECTGRESAFS